MDQSVTNVREVAEQVNTLMQEIRTTQAKRTAWEAVLDKEVETAKAKHGPRIEKLAQQEATLVDRIVELVTPSFALLATKGSRTITLRDGEIKLRDTAETLEVAGKEEVIIGRIRRHRGLTRFTRVGKRTLNKDALKKDALKKAPDFVRKIQGLTIVRHTNLIIKPAKAQGEIVRSADSLSITLAKED